MRSGRKLNATVEVERATRSHLDDPTQPVYADEMDIDDAVQILDELQRMLWWDDEAGDWDPKKETDPAEVWEHLVALMEEQGLRPGGEEDV